MFSDKQGIISKHKTSLTRSLLLPIIGCHSIVINKNAIIEEFFVLRTRVAGEILQKFINYHFKLAIVGDFSGYTSKPLKDFLYECNKGKDIFFVSSEQDAIEKLGQ